MNPLDQLKLELRESADPAKAKQLAIFFKTPDGKPANDHFLGVVVPKQRVLSKKYYSTITLKDTERLLKSPWHEERLIALFILVLKYQKGSQNIRRQVFEMYTENIMYIDNWDLVDSSAEFIVGPWLEENPYKMKVLTNYAKSSAVWERRIAMLATFHYIKQGRADEALVVIDFLLHDKEPYIHKAVGWMLREIGKRVDRKVLTTFLDSHATMMPRIALRYAIEHLSAEQQRSYLDMKKTSTTLYE